MRFKSEGLKRTGTIRPFASPLGSLGRPIFGLVALCTIPILLNDCGLYGGLWRHHRWNVKHCNVAPWFRWIVGVMHPSVNSICLRVSFQPEDLNNPVPNYLPLKSLCYRDAFKMLGFPAVQMVDHVAQFLDMRHAAASTRSPTLKKLEVTLAAIAGVMRNVP